MPDDVKPAEPAATPTPAPPAPTPDPAAVKAGDARIEKLESMVGALADTVRAAMTPRQTAANENATPGELPGHFRSLLRQQGLTDADINANAPIIVPFLTAMLATDGATIASGIQNVKDEVEMVKAARNTKRYPFWGDLEDKIVELREGAAKNGQYLSPADAYKAAVAVDVAAGDESRIEAAKTRRREAAAANAADVSAQNFVHHGGREGQQHVRRTALSAEEIAAMPRAERKKLFAEQLGDMPIR